MSETSIHQQRAASFDRAADLYEAARPDYPGRAIEWMVADDALAVLDLGAGTGKLTAALVREGRTVHAVDPSAEMLRVLSAKLPDVDARLGRGDAIPLPDASVDVVTVAQAWHWMETAATVAEIARVLRPGGTLALVWNADDDRVPWVRALDVVTGSEGRYQPLAATTVDSIGVPFGAGEAAEFSWTRRMSRAGLLAYESSVSAFLIKPPAEQADTLRGIEAVLDAHPESETDDGVIELPYVTQAFRYRRA